ncbi:MAG: HD domain-containing protein, partial [Parcubacteria group bacterium]|nr:HD domain-containing protein [Parcubacteria group bacterium]
MADSFTVDDRVYGRWEVRDPLALSLIALPAFQRLYQVGQYGSYWFGLPHANTNRAEHSLGVYYLLKHFGASYEEQIAGLLHDISHTVFSHVIDYVYNDVSTQGVQDRAHASI